MSPEATYLAALVHRFAHGANRAAEPPAGLQWDELLGLLQAHGIVGTLADLILRAELAPELEVRVRTMKRWAERRAAVIGLELGRLLEALEKARLETIVLKGTALGRTVYAHPSMRFTSDIDLLVRADALDPAIDALAALGYRPAQTERHESFYRRHHFHWTVLGPGEVKVEIHWALSRPGDFFDFDLDRFFSESRLVDDRGLGLRVPSMTCQLLHAAGQALREGYADLRRIIDTALLIEHGALSDVELPRAARRQGLAAALWVLLTLQRQIAAVDVPAAVLDALRPGWLRRRCLESLGLAERSLDGSGFQHAASRKLAIWLSAPGLADAAGEVGRFVFPGEAELLDAGGAPERLPGPAARSWMAVQQLAVLGKIAGYQGWCLLAAPGRTGLARPPARVPPPA